MFALFVARFVQFIAEVDHCVAISKRQLQIERFNLNTSILIESL